MECEPLAPNYGTRRDRRRATSPIVSVVIASNDSEDVLGSCISSLRARFDPKETEYVVAWAGSAQAGIDLKRQFGYARFVSVSSGSSPVDLRVQGIKAATGDIVLLVQQDQAQDAALPLISMANASDALREHTTSSKWGERLALRASRQSTTVASNG